MLSTLDKDWVSSASIKFKIFKSEEATVGKICLNFCLMNEDDLKNEDNLKYEEDLKYEDDLKLEENFKYAKPNLTNRTCK